ncbi:hypothetical protein FRB95_013465, partial [Tulasnella sp. JGI-2019a]
MEDQSSSSKRGFVLLGQAGTGKSSIASSIAGQEAKSQRLGAVFHFTRDEQSRNKGAVLVITRQLASWADRRLRSKIASAIESAMQEGLDITQMTLNDQFQQLIQEPLETLDGASPALLIILDALDECDGRYASELLRLICGLLDKLPAQIKVFITSRGEPHLQRCYNSDTLTSQLEIHSLGEEKIEVVEEDISMYFKEQLPDMVNQWVAEPSNWPGEERRRALVHKTQGLFICATTVARMLADPNVRDPERQLEAILSSNKRIYLDEIYAQILKQACPTSSDGDLLADFRNVLGALVVARVPINIYTLASLLSPSGPQNQKFAHRVRVTVLSYLQAVLIVPSVDASEVARDTQPIRFIHSSFIDYLTDSSRCEPRFLLDLGEQHKQLAIRCLQRTRDLKRNMCNLDPSLLNSEVEDLAQRIDDNIPPGLQYACAHLSMHVSQTPPESVEVRGLVEEFANTGLMYWVEGLSLMGRVHEAVGMARLMESWLETGLHLLPRTSPFTSPHAASPNSSLGHLITLQHSSQTVPGSAALGKRARLKHFFKRVGTSIRAQSVTAAVTGEVGHTARILHDLQRFILEFMEPITISTLHIYMSALELVPSETRLSHRYRHLAGSGVRVIRGRAEQWPQHLWTASKHSGGVNCVAICADGVTIVSGSEDHTLHLWDARTGAAIGKAMKGHTDVVSCIAVSSDGTTIVSGSWDCTLCLWDAKTGAAVGEAMKGHTGSVSCIAVSPDGTTIISGSNDHTLHLWDAKTRSAIGVAMTGHTSFVNCITVSPDGTTIVSGSDDCTLCLWDAKTGAPIGKAMTGHTDGVNCIAASPDGATIVSGSWDCTVCLWDVKTGVVIGE